MRNVSIFKRAILLASEIGVVFFGFLAPLFLIACIGYPNCIIPWYLAIVLMAVSIAVAALCVGKMNRIEREIERTRRMCRRYALLHDCDNKKVG